MILIAYLSERKSYMQDVDIYCADRSEGRTDAKGNKTSINVKGPTSTICTTPIPHVQIIIKYNLSLFAL